MTLRRSVQDRWSWSGASQIMAWAPGVELASTVARFGRDDEIFREEDEATHVYKVLSGAVRLTRLLDDGRRHIASFHFAGEVFGLELGAEHRFSAEAVGVCQIARVRRTDVSACAETDKTTAHAMWRTLSDELMRAREQALLLGRMSAMERVTSFLRDMAKRGVRSDLVELPMSRTDIADYLGLTIETVSRTFTQLQKRGAIGLDGARCINLRPALQLAAA